MDMIKDILKEELDYSLELQDQYRQNLNSLPKGNLSIKKINGREYIYFQYRSGDKVISRVIPEQDISACKDKIDQRERYKRLLKEVNDKINYIRKALNVRK